MYAQLKKLKSNINSYSFITTKIILLIIKINFIDIHLIVSLDSNK